MRDVRKKLRQKVSRDEHRLTGTRCGTIVRRDGEKGVEELAGEKGESARVFEGTRKRG